MSAIQLNLIAHTSTNELVYQHLRIQITAADGVVEPSDLVGLSLPEGIEWSQGVVIEGRAPIWVYAYLVHQCHPTTWVGCYDPRLGGAVVVESHQKGVTVGSVLKLTLPS